MSWSKKLIHLVNEANRINKFKYIIYDLKKKKVVEIFRNIYTAETMLNEKKKNLFISKDNDTELITRIFSEPKSLNS